MPNIVFHWERVYSQAAQMQAVLDGREPTLDDMIVDGSRQPVYRFTAFAVPSPTVQDRHRFCRLFEAAGFRKDRKSATWSGPGGEGAAVALKTALDDAGVSATHYHDIPSVLIVNVDLDGLL